MTTFIESDMLSDTTSHREEVDWEDVELNIAKKPRLDASAGLVIDEHLCPLTAFGANFYMSDEESGDLYKFNKLGECMCCARHQVDRPESLYSGWMVLGRGGCGFAEGQGKCGCKCRQSMRFLARKYDSRLANPRGGWTVGGWKDVVEVQSDV